MKTKKNTTIGVRVDDDMLQIISRVSEAEDRPLATMARKLIEEALITRKLMKPKRK
jgi:hypothetical protein